MSSHDERITRSRAIAINDEGIADLYQLLSIAVQASRARLAQAQDNVRSHREALDVCDRKTRSLDWASTQRLLGHALLLNGELAEELGGSVDTNLPQAVIVTSAKAGLPYLQNAVTAYRAALEVYTREEFPIEWAGTQNNLGTALGTLGLQIAAAEGMSLLEEALLAYRTALKVRTRDQHPLEWALTQRNIGQALNYLGMLDGSNRKLRIAEARKVLEAARELYQARGETEAARAVEKQLSSVNR